LFLKCLFLRPDWAIEFQCQCEIFYIYRDEVEEIARKLNVTGFVENVKPYDVRIVAEGEDEHIDRFIRAIKINRFPIDVENVEVDFDDFTGEFDYFEIKRGDWGEEIVESLDTMVKLLYKPVELD
jgi:acylphosphatase